MKQPRIRMWIDARNERIDLNQTKEAVFVIKDLDKEETRKLLIEAIFAAVKEIQILEKPQNAIKVRFNPALTSLSFIEYLLTAKSIVFTREDS